ncbi:hypothetical protein [Paraburkholderia youngii]|uniref:hypothetical protein n=1 Tax=Paraburkholderia youngii TaxID=2782701 RepID=UPI003D1C607A
MNQAMPPEARALRDRVEAAIARELARCERQMTPGEWDECSAWVTEYVVAAAREYVGQRSSRLLNLGPV